MKYYPSDHWTAIVLLPEKAFVAAVQLQEQCDVFVSHDWPRGIYHHGNKQRLIQNKRYFKEEIDRNELGSPANEQLLNSLQVCTFGRV